MYVGVDKTGKQRRTGNVGHLAIGRGARRSALHTDDAAALDEDECPTGQDTFTVERRVCSVPTHDCSSTAVRKFVDVTRPD